MQKKRIAAVSTVSLSVAVLCVFSWISIPTVPPITVQLLAVLLIALLLPLWQGITAILAYIAIGCFLPVFSGFQTIGGLLSSAGAGYVLGFFAILLFVSLSRKISDRVWMHALFAEIGIFVCYLIGLFWYYFVYLDGAGGFFAAVAVCVLPFILPDTVKLFIALLIYKRLRVIPIFCK